MGSAESSLTPDELAYQQLVNQQETEVESLKRKQAKQMQSLILSQTSVRSKAQIALKEAQLESQIALNQKELTDLQNKHAGQLSTMVASSSTSSGANKKHRSTKAGDEDSNDEEEDPETSVDPTETTGTILPSTAVKQRGIPSYQQYANTPAYKGIDKGDKNTDSSFHRWDVDLDRITKSTENAVKRQTDIDPRIKHTTGTGKSTNEHSLTPATGTGKSTKEHSLTPSTGTGKSTKEHSLTPAGKGKGEKKEKFYSGKPLYYDKYASVNASFTLEY